MLALVALLAAPTGQEPAPPCSVVSVVPPDAEPSDQFGSSAAVDGEWAIVGARNAAGPGTIPHGGAVYVFKREGDEWVEYQRITAVLARDDDQFGAVVDISGTLAAAGAPHDDEALVGVGSVRVLELAGTDWVETAKLLAPDAEQDDQFGTAVAVDGETIAVGVPQADQGAGAVYVFTWDGTWGSPQKLTPVDGVPFGSQSFGNGVSLEGDLLAVASPGHEGSVHVYRRIGSTFVQESKLVSTVANASHFGSVVVTGGQVLAGVDWPSGQGGDAVLVYEHTPFGWIQADELRAPSTGNPFAEFGSSIESDGDRIIVAGNGNTSGAQGFAFFRYNGDAWEFESELFLFGAEFNPNDETRPFDVFGETYVVGDLNGPPEALIKTGVTHFGTVDDHAAPLFSCDTTISAAEGGVQRMQISGGAESAGKTFLVLGSLSGTDPGFSLGGLHVPLNPDSYLVFSATQANNPPPLLNTLGALGSDGEAVAYFDLPGGFAQALAGSVLHHAFLLVELGPTAKVSFASNALPLQIGS